MCASVCVLVACGGAACGGGGGAPPTVDASTEVDGAATEVDMDRPSDLGRDMNQPDLHVEPDLGPPLLGPPYPIVLAHGFFGFEELGGSFLTYFYGVKDALAEAGETAVYTPAVDPFNDSFTRGEELAAAVASILAETGHEKVVIVAHSQGGIDARYVASTRPDQVAAIVTISTPHYGTPLIDFVLQSTDNPVLREWVDGLIRLVGRPLWDAAGEETSFFHALQQLSESGAAAFNEEHPNVPGIDYYSIAGRSDLHLAREKCAVDEPLDFLAAFDDTRDPIEPLFSASEELIDGGLFAPEPNDGLVRVSSAKWGTFLGCIPADHMDEIGHLFGDRPGLGNNWDYLQFYIDLAAWIRDQGY